MQGYMELAAYTIPVMLVSATEVRGLAKEQHYPLAVQERCGHSN